MKKYRGTVEPHSRIQDLLTPESNYDFAFQTFQSYWNDGYDPEVGRDTYLSKPSEAKDSAIGRIHLRPIEFTGKEKEEFGKSATEECWDEWESVQEVPSVDSSSDDIPTSNEWVVYCVDSQRNACMLAYLEESLDPHTFCRDLDNMRNFIAMANEWFAANSTEPMSAKDFPHIFSDDWLEA